MTFPTPIPKIYREQAGLFRAMGHPARIAILNLLQDGEQCVCHLEAMLGLRQSYISQHLMVLREAGLVVDRRDGWNIFYRRTPAGNAMLSEALKVVAGKRSPGLPHARAGDDCSCPKCSGQGAKPAVSHHRATSNAHA
jgi:ArsR family transcriptional regulator